MIRKATIPFYICKNFDCIDTDSDSAVRIFRYRLQAQRILCGDLFFIPDRLSYAWHLHHQ